MISFADWSYYIKDDGLDESDYSVCVPVQAIFMVKIGKPFKYGSAQ
jgi:hypothetical protein